MPQYRVKITETLSKEITLTASSEKEAARVVRQLYEMEQIVLDADSLESIDYEVSAE